MHLNDLVEVKLTEHGLWMWNHYGGTELVIDGKLRLPLWKLMNLFGEFIYNQNPDIFVNNEVKILRGVD